MLGRNAIYKHVGLWCHDCGVDETKEEETTDQGTDSVVCRIWVLLLHGPHLAVSSASGVGPKGTTHPCKALNLLTYPPDTVWDAVNAVNDRIQEAVHDLHEHCHPRRDDGLNVAVRCSRLWRDATGKNRREGACLLLNLRDHLLVNLDRVDLEIEIFVFCETVDAFSKYALEIALSGATPCVRCHHPGDGGIGTEEGSKFGGSFELGGENRLEHGEKQVFFSAFVLVSIERKHDSLQESVDLR